MPFDVESQWDQLLEYIEQGLVIPVVGPGLLQVQTGQGVKSYYAYLAEKLAKRLGVSDEDLPGGSELNEVACRHLQGRGQADEIYTKLAKLVKEEPLPIPEALLQLASIATFRLFITTTFPSFLERAVNQIRFEGQPSGVEVLSYSDKRMQDLCRPLDDYEKPVIYHILGKLSNIPDFAVTHEDILEYVHLFQSEQRVPPLLYRETEDRSLLILGCRFNDWLARFFLRAWRRMRMSAGYSRPIFIADNEVFGDTNLIEFLNSFSPGTRVFPVTGPVEFVGELHRRWNELHPPDQAPSRPVPAVAPESHGPYVFISYASEDGPAAKAIHDALTAAGIDNFFDKQGLEGGDNWDFKLRRIIEKCSLFVVVISKNVLTNAPRYFRAEWEWAIDVYKQLPAYYSPDDVFLLPVTIDGTNEDNTRIPPEFRRAQWIDLSSGPTADFVQRVKRLHRQAQQEKAGVR